MKTITVQDKKDTHSYKGWLNSDFWINRAIAIYFYNILGGIISMLLLFIIGFSIAFVYEIFKAVFGL